MEYIIYTNYVLNDQNAMYKTINKNNIQLLERILNKFDYKINYANTGFNFGDVFMCAVKNNNIKIMNLMFNKLKNHYDFFRCFLIAKPNTYAQPNISPLMYAIKNNN